MRSFTLSALFLAVPAIAFPTFAGAGLSRRAIDANGCVLPGSFKERAAPYTSKFPYTGAKLDGLAGPGNGLKRVPAPGDDAHRFEQPSIGAIRGSCPGLNAAANHGFLARDGVSTYEELIAMAQNVYNLGHDLAVTLTTFGVAADGDMDRDLVSIGGNATCVSGAYGGGLSWHLRFEGDTSLTRNDYNVADGDNFSFNGTLYRMMTDTVASTSSKKNPLYDYKGLALYRAQRYEQSKAENPSFYYGPKALVLFGGASFLYRVFPTWGGQPDAKTIGTFFGAVSNKEGTFDFQAERIPDNWVNLPKPFTLYDMAVEMNDMYYAYPKLFGGNNGAGNFTADALQLPKEKGTVSEFMCFLYDYVTDKSNPQPVLSPQQVKYITTRINPAWAQFNCDWVVAP